MIPIFRTVEKLVGRHFDLSLRPHARREENIRTLLPQFLGYTSVSESVHSSLEDQ